jgi:hypothetical protein
MYEGWRKLSKTRYLSIQTTHTHPLVDISTLSSQLRSNSKQIIWNINVKQLRVHKQVLLLQNGAKYIYNQLDPTGIIIRVSVKRYPSNLSVGIFLNFGPSYYQTGKCTCTQGSSCTSTLCTESQSLCRPSKRASCDTTLRHTSSYTHVMSYWSIR